MTPYRQPVSRPGGARDAAATEELVIGVMSLVVGAIPCASAIGGDAPMGPEATLGLSLILVGAAISIGGLVRIIPAGRR